MGEYWCVMSRKWGNKKWYRHIPGEASEQRAREKAALWTIENPALEYTVQVFESNGAPSPVLPNGQLRHPRRRRHR